MKQYFTPKNILIAICLIYAISVTERLLNKETRVHDVIVQYEREKGQMQSIINQLEIKTQQYESKIKITNAVIDSYDNGQLDSVWTNLFKTR